MVSLPPPPINPKITHTLMHLMVVIEFFKQLCKNISTKQEANLEKELPKRKQIKIFLLNFMNNVMRSELFTKL